MKNKEKQKPKEKEFTSSPFKGLKGAGLDLRAPAAATPSPLKKPEPPPQEADDTLLFLNAVEDVRRIHAPSSTRVGQKKKEEVKGRLDDEEQRTFLRALEALKLDVRFDEELPDEKLRPVAVNRLRQVRRGGIRIDLQLDLHGLTKDEALENLDRFVKGAYNRGQKGVLVITGKGNNSSGEPVLKGAVAAWLREHGKGMVSEFVQAPSEMGGSGAIVVFLKEKKAPQEQEKPEQ